jgi:UV DNA damage endonuclease
MLRTVHNLTLCFAHRSPQRALFVTRNFRAPLSAPNMAKRKRSTVAAALPTATEAPVVDRSKVRQTEVPLPPNITSDAPEPRRRQSSCGEKIAPTNPNTNPDVLDGVSALRASPDGYEDGPPESLLTPGMTNGTINGAAKDVTAQKLSAEAPANKGRRKKVPATQVKVEPDESKDNAVNGVAKKVSALTETTGMAGDPEDAEGLEDDEVEIKEALSRPPPVNSDYLPLPWKGRLGYVCASYPRHVTSINRCIRPASTRTSAPQILPCSALEHVVLQASSSIGIL